MSPFLSFLPELVLLAGVLVLFFVTLGANAALARTVCVAAALGVFAATLATLGHTAVLFDGAYRVDGFSQLLKLAAAFGFLCLGLVSGELRDIRSDARPEYFLFLTLSFTGLVMLVSSIDVIPLVVALELSSFPLYLLVAMRRERAGHKTQMESAIKYIMFGIAANGVMLFGLGYIYGLTGSTSLPVILEKLPPVLNTPLAITGLALTLSGFLYKLAVFPFHFWTPDVYEGAANEASSLIASLPKIGAVAVLVRFVSLASPGHETMATLLTCLAIASMVYGNLIALVQTDLKRLLGFSGIAHAGYVLVGFVALDRFGFAAALYYIVGYMLMVLACFVVICQLSRDGENVSIEALAGLHRRSPLLAVTLIVGIFALAGMPPFVGFMAKLNLLTAAWSRGHTLLVVVTVINSAIAVYYYLRIVRQAFFSDKEPVTTRIPLAPSVIAACVLLVVAITALGVAPAPILDAITRSLAEISVPPLH